MTLARPVAARTSMDVDECHPAADLMRFFAWEHLPPHLQQVSRPVGELAQHMLDTLPYSPELRVGLRRLLEAKDCLVRAALPPDSPKKE